MEPQVLPEQSEERLAAIGDLDLAAVDVELERGASAVGHGAEDRFGPMRDLPSPRLSRRSFLAGSGAMAGAVLLGACGDDDTDTDTGGSPSATGGDGGTAAPELFLAQFFGGPMLVAGTELRAPFGVRDADGLLPSERAPETLIVELHGPDGAAVGDPIEVPRHDDGLPNSYYPLRVTLPEAGIYTARTELEGEAVEMQLQVLEAAEVEVIQPGAVLPAVDTPTLDDPRGVQPICTNDPVCPLHDVTLSQAMTEGTPIALLVATPAFCQIAVCGPVLDVLLAARDAHPGVRFLHAEVYADPSKDLDTYAPVVTPLGLHFEPCLLLAGPGGTVVERLDTIFDRVELDERLTRLA